MSALRSEAQAWWTWERRAPLIFGLKLAGLVVSFAACSLILTLIDFETHYDAWNPGASRIMRGVETRDVASNSRSVSLPYDFADAARTGLAGVTDAARVQPLRVMLQRGQDRFNETLFFVDPSFLPIFDVQIARGNARPLDQSDSLMISERAARNYFGAQNPIGRTVTIGGLREVTVTAVMKNWPADSHIRPDFLLPLEGFFAMAQQQGGVDRSRLTGWTQCHCYATYLRFDTPAAALAARSSIRAFLVSQQGEEYAARTPIELQSLREVYLGSSKIAAYLDHAAQGDTIQLAVFGAVALVLLLISGLSFANFSAAQATMRAREFAVRRILGAQRRDVIARTAVESTLLSFAAALLGLLLGSLLIGLFAQFVERPLTASAVWQPERVTQLIVIALLVGALAGLMPGAVVAKINPVILLRGSLGNQAARLSAGGVRRVLIGLQFVVSSALVIFAIAIHAQLDFVSSQPRGYDPRGKIIVNAEGAYESLGDLRARIEALPGVSSVSIAGSVPTIPSRGTLQFVRQGADQREAKQIVLNGVDAGHLKTLSMQLIAGRDFNPAFGGDQLNLAPYFSTSPPSGSPVVSVIINRSAAAQLGLGEPSAAIDQILTFSGPVTFPFTLRVVGVAEDVRYRGPRDSVEPMIYLARSDWQVNLHEPRYLVVATTGGSPLLATQIGKAWDELVPGFVHDVTWLEDRIAQQTAGERRQFQLVTLFMIAAILVSLFGILGFAAFSMRSDARQLAIRRVLGATRDQIALLVSGAQLRIVLVAALVACPIAWWIIVRWLDGFVLRTPLQVSWFALGCAAIAAISFAILFVFTLRLSAMSPMKILRSE